MKADFVPPLSNKDRSLPTQQPLRRLSEAVYKHYSGTKCPLGALNTTHFPAGKQRDGDPAIRLIAQHQRLPQPQRTPNLGAYLSSFHLNSC